MLRRSGEASGLLRRSGEASEAFVLAGRRGSGVNCGSIVDRLVWHFVRILCVWLLVSGMVQKVAIVIMTVESRSINV